ncbi:MAG: calcium-binding protein [Alphaproteobacteria bacterium]
MATIQQIEQQLLSYSATGNTLALKNLLTSLTTTELASISSTVNGNVLTNLAYAPITETARASSIRDFMQKLGPNVPVSAIGTAMERFAASGNVAALDAVTDYLDVNQKGTIPQVALSNTLLNLLHAPITETARASSTRDFMQKLGPNVPVSAIGTAMERFASSGNVAALDAVTDYLDVNQKGAISQATLGNTLIGLAYTGGILSADVTAQAVEDFMTKFGPNVPTSALSSAIERLVTNAAGLDGILNNISAYQFAQLPQSTLASLTHFGNIVGNYNNYETINGTEGHDQIFGLGGSDIINGGGGHDSLFGDVGNDRLHGGTGVDLLMGGQNGDTYLFNRGDSADTIREDGGSDTLILGTGIARDQLWFQKSGTDLVIRVIGGTDMITVDDWYLSTGFHVETIKTAAGNILTDTKVQNLVNAMAGMSVPSGTTMTQSEHAALDAVIAANWT